MIKDASEMLQIGIDSVWEKLEIRIKSQMVESGKTNLYLRDIVPEDILSSETFAKQLISAGYDVILSSDEEYVQIISWKNALPNRKGEVIPEI